MILIIIVIRIEKKKIVAGKQRTGIYWNGEVEAVTASPLNNIKSNVSFNGVGWLVVMRD